MQAGYLSYRRLERMLDLETTLGLFVRLWPQTTYVTLGLASQ